MWHWKIAQIRRSSIPRRKACWRHAAIEMVKYARTSNPTGTIQFEQAMAEELPFPDAYFDLVFSTMTFHHWPSQSRGIAEVARVLTPRGRWVLADFVASGFMRQAQRLLRLRQFPELSYLQSMLLDAGLKEVAERRVPGLGGQIAVMSIARITKTA